MRGQTPRKDGRFGVHRLEEGGVGRGFIAIDDDVVCGQHLIVAGRILEVIKLHGIHLHFRPIDILEGG